jgi:molecular chaperone DnaJ
MANKDYYKILGISRDANEVEIKKAFREKAHKFHPDKPSGDEAKFKEINEAYQVLNNPQKRGQYDKFGSDFANSQTGQGFSGWQNASGYGDNIDFEDLGDIFSGMGDIFGFGGSKGRSRSQSRGNDIQIILTLNLEEIAFGVEKEIELEKNIVCSHCSGKGYEPNSKVDTCSTCQGRGEVIQAQRTIFGNFQSKVTCPKCQGEGKIYVDKCSKCSGHGAIKDKVKMQVKIPAGINEGQSIKLSGSGEAGLKGAIPGDLFIKVKIKNHSEFERDGDDIKSVKKLSFSQVALGDKIDILTLDGKVKLKIPEGTQSNTTFRLKGKGLGHLQSRGRGDHLVKIMVETPKKLSKKQKEIIRDLGL